MKLVCFFAVLSFLTTTVHGNICNDHSSKGCKSCVNQTHLFGMASCRWCELDNKCHKAGSSGKFNPCTTSQVIKTANNCIEPLVFAEYSPSKAYELLRLATIPYANDKKGAIHCLESQNSDEYEIVEWIGRRCEDLSLIRYKECLAVVMISHKSKAIVLAYRGTTAFKQLLDIVIKTLSTFKVSAGTGSGKVQEYFKQAHDKLYSCVKASIRDQISNYPEYDIWITGHSLGGAIASIASARLIYEGLINKEKIALYTFGMPKVGNRQYAFEHNRLVNNSWRVVHRYDPVPHFPVSIPFPWSPLHHRTEVYYPLKRMPPTETNYIICPGSDDNNCGSPFPPDLGDLEDHKIYFEIPVGTYCQTAFGRKRRSTNSAMWSHFTSGTCSRIKNPDFSGYDYPTSLAFTLSGNIQTTMFLILFKYLMLNMLNLV